MLRVHFDKLAVPAHQALEELRQVYSALRAAAIRENDLRVFAEADLALASLELASYALAQPGSYIRPAHYLKAEPSDTTEGLLQERQGFGHHPPVGYLPPAG